MGLELADHEDGARLYRTHDLFRRPHGDGGLVHVPSGGGARPAAPAPQGRLADRLFGRRAPDVRVHGAGQFRPASCRGRAVLDSGLYDAALGLAWRRPDLRREGRRPQGARLPSRNGGRGRSLQPVRLRLDRSLFVDRQRLPAARRSALGDADPDDQSVEVGEFPTRTRAVAVPGRLVSSRPGRDRA